MSIAGPLSKAYTQPYSLGKRIKLIICHLRHEISATIHEISLSLKNKTLDGGPYIIQIYYIYSAAALYEIDTVYLF